MTLSETASLLRAAVAVGDFAQVEPLSAAYRMALEECWNRMSPEERSRSPLPAEALELFGNLKKRTAIHRALLTERRAELPRQAAYENVSATNHQTWQFEG